MSQLLQTACDEAREGNSSIKQQVRDIGNKFINSVEISAQGAVYIVLQLPMRKSSRQVIFINTAPPEERVKLLKPMNEIEKMDDESEEVHSSGLLNRYMKRPSSLENVTLADWAALYDSRQKPFVKKLKDIDTDNLQLETADDEENDDELPDCANEVMQNIKQSKPKQCLKPRIIPHSINYEETGTSEGLWDRLGRQKVTNMSFFNVFKAPSFALVNSASQSNATGSEMLKLTCLSPSVYPNDPTILY